MMVLLGLKSEATLRGVGVAAIFYAKSKTSAKPSSANRSTKFYFRRVNGTPVPANPFSL